MNGKSSSLHLRWSGSWIYFALALAWSWLFWIPAAVLSQQGTGLLITALHYIGGIGPPLAAIVLLYLTQDRAGRRDYWRRVVDFRAELYQFFVTVLAAIVVTVIWGQKTLTRQQQSDPVQEVRPACIL